MARGFNYAPGASAEVHDARRPDLHKTQILALGSSKNPLVRTAVAERSDCPLGLMVTLAHDYATEVRAAVAANPIAQRTVMAYLSADRSVEVLKALLTNPSLPSEILEDLAFHKKAEVRAVAAARLNGGGLAPLDSTEDSHTPELAEHVPPLSSTAREHAPAPPAVVNGFTPDGVEWVNVEPAVPDPAPPPTRHDLAPPSPQQTPRTRTAPVRGFKPPTS